MVRRARVEYPGNPVRTAICISVKDYPWSSDRFYRKMESGFVEFGLLLDMLSANSKQSVRKYSQLMEQDDNYVPEKLTTTENTSPEGLNQSKEINGGRRPLDEILMDTGINGEELELIKRGSRMRRLTAAKKAYAKKSWDQGYSLGEIARHINISTVAVFKYLNRRNGE